MANQTLMAIGAHADDIELQAGGTVAKYHAAGYRIVYVMSTNNFSGGISTLHADGSITSRPANYKEMEPLRKKEAADAARFFGTEPIHLDHAQRHCRDVDGRRLVVNYGSPLPEGIDPARPTILTACDDAASITRVADLIVEHQPEAILTHGGAMENVEHFATLVLVTRAYWEAVDRGFGGMLLSWHDLGVNLFAEAYKDFDSFVDITAYWDAKIAACALHACQKPDPARLDWPQYGPACGCGQAEVFTLIGRPRRPEQYGAFTLEILRNLR